jgi:hypothetical protein
MRSGEDEQSQWLAVFNEVFKETRGNEDAAFAAARGVLKAALLMPGARVIEIEAVALAAESSPGSVPYSELVERVKVLEQKHLEDHGCCEA